ncbi:ATP-binding cassette domain-containing protein [Mongoliimonas terrestris]|uniref:ATP-binding cassette domain-containing protein n=1 Tax=Mongoliimonas terrestris TaxID=1709001 RepID=UPI001FD89A1D|nr:ATP-binding cassette domain-containing protein [Mongoliimonas terrestris]
MEVDAVSFAYRSRKVLDTLSFRVERGRFTALLGPNGAGKTTLFALVTRLFDSPEGVICIMGKDPRRDGAAALGPLGVVFQSETLDLDLTVRQNLHYFAALHGLRAREATARIEAELAAVDMAEKIDVRVRDLNGGHRRRVEIARALLHGPDLLLLDEPTVGLDVPSRRAIVERVHALARDRNVGVLWTTHLIDEVDPGDALIVLHKGRIVADGQAADVVRASGQDTLAAAFDALTAAEETGR